MLEETLPNPISEGALPCPACGYDLRAAPQSRCPECGLEIDLQSLKLTAIPWADRKKIGRIRAYLKTVWQFTFNTKRLRHEASKPQTLADAKYFRRVTAVLLAVTFLALFSTLVYFYRGLNFVAVDVDPFARGALSLRDLTALELDLVVPWCAAATLLPVIPLCLILLAITLSGLQRHIFRHTAAPLAHRQRAFALSHYASAPVVFLLPSVISFSILMILAAPVMQISGRTRAPTIIKATTKGSTSPR